MRSSCKHILLVLLFAREVTDIKIQDKTEFKTQKVVNFLQKSNIDPTFKAKNAAKKKSAAQFREILSTHSDNIASQTYEHVVKINRSISCSGLNCKAPKMIGDRCVKVDGALNVPFGREYAVKKLFFFCPKLHYASSLEQYTYYTSSSYSQRWQHTRWRPWTSYGGYEKYLLTSRFWLDFYLD